MENLMLVLATACSNCIVRLLATEVFYQPRYIHAAASPDFSEVCQLSTDILQHSCFAFSKITSNL